MDWSSITYVYVILQILAEKSHMPIHFNLKLRFIRRIIYVMNLFGL